MSENGGTQRLRKIDRCPLCGESDRLPWLDALGFELTQCLGCKHRYASAVFDSTSLATQYYNEAGQQLVPASASSKLTRFAEYRELLRERSVPVGRVLDVGCNTGELLSLFRADGWQVAGIESSPGPAAIARAHVTDLWEGFVEDVLPTDQTFDLITICHVLEHIPEPIPILRRLRSALRPGGALLVEVPNANDALSAVWRGSYRPLCPGDHVSFFDVDSLRAALQRAGFATSKVLSPTHARDVVYSSALSLVDMARNGRRTKQNQSGVDAQFRYRGRWREPIRRVLDSLVERLDPPVAAAARVLFPSRGSVLVALAIPSGAQAAER